MGKKQSDFDWLKKHLKIISDLGARVKDENPTTDYGNYTALKLIAVHYMSDVFSKVARHPKRQVERFDGAVFVDLFAGTGYVKLDTGDLVAGSSPCAFSNPKGFDFSILVEKQKDRCGFLDERMSRIASQNSFEIIHGDSNKVIGDVIAKIRACCERPILLIFVDPEGLEIKFRTLKALSDAFQNCDFLINVNTSGVSRVAGKAKKGIDNIVQSLEDYLDENVEVILREFALGRTPEDKYRERIQEILGKQMGDTIPIRDNGGKIAYYLLYYTRTTRGGSGYSDAFTTLKQRLEKLDGNHVRRALDQIYHRSDSLDAFN